MIDGYPLNDSINIEEKERGRKGGEGRFEVLVWCPEVRRMMWW